MSNNSNYSNIGASFNDSGEIEEGIDFDKVYTPPPMPSGGFVDEGDDDPFKKLKEDRERRQKKVKVLGWIGGVLAALLAVAGSFFWYSGLQQINSASSDPAQVAFDTGQKAYNNGSWQDSIDQMNSLLTKENQDKYIVAVLYIFGADANLAKKNASTPDIASKYYKEALKYIGVGDFDKIAEIAAKDPLRKPPARPSNYASFKLWADDVKMQSDLNSKYLAAVTADSEAAITTDATKKLGLLNSAIAKWEDLYRLQPLYLVENEVDGVAERLIGRYLDLAKLTCQTGYVTKAQAVAANSTLGLSARFMAQIPAAREDLAFRKCQ